MPMNPDAESYKLRFGPYSPPAVNVGDEIQCELRGRVVVADWSDRGDIMWPRCKTSRRRALILTGDLISACQNETAMAVARHWSVTVALVQKWKRAIGAPFRTPGTEIVLSKKAHDSLVGRPALPQVKAALLQAAQQPKSKNWKLQLAVRNKMRAIEQGKIIASHNADHAYAVMQMYVQGKSMPAIARDLGITRQAVHQILHNTTTRREQMKGKSFTAPRCACGMYSLSRAYKLDHDCKETI